MDYNLINYFAQQLPFIIIRDLLYSKNQKHLRSFVSNYGHSPAGTADVLRRLENLNVLKISKNKNRKCYKLTIPEAEAEVFYNFFKKYEEKLIQNRAKKYSLHAAEKLRNMDQAYSFYKKVKQK